MNFGKRLACVVAFDGDCLGGMMDEMVAVPSPESLLASCLQSRVVLRDYYFSLWLRLYSLSWCGVGGEISSALFGCGSSLVA